MLLANHVTMEIRQAVLTVWLLQDINVCLPEEDPLVIQFVETEYLYLASHAIMEIRLDVLIV